MTNNRTSLWKRARFAPLVAFLMLVCSFGVRAANVGLAWDASADTSVTGYRLYFGTASGVYPNVLETGGTSLTLSNLQNGQTYYFAVTATNAAGVESDYSKEIFYTVPVPNTAPLAMAQSVTTAEDTAKAITLTGSDADGNTLTFAVVTAPTKGTLSGTAPNLTYTPSANYNGGDSFTFRVNDGQTNSATATVSITVSPVNDAPVAAAQSVTTAEDAAKTITLAGSDIDGDPLTYAVVTAPTKGTLSGSAPNLTYTPNANATGTDSFTFRANDGSVNSATATVSITITAVNDAPIADAQSISTLEDTAKAITLTGSDVDGNTLTYAIVAQPAKGTLSGTAPNFTYTPSANYNGPDSFTFRVNDGTVSSATATVSITVTAVNDAPVANAQSVTTPENTAKAMTLTGNDVDGDPLTFSVVLPPTKGTLSGTAPNLTYTPSANYNGSDSFTFTVNDGTVDSAVTTVTITVTPVNSAPVAQVQSVTTPEDTAKTIMLVATDDDGDALNYSIVTPPTKGTLSGVAPNLTYTPSLNASGSDSFTFRASDGTTNSAVATVSITITPVNDTPVAIAQSVTTAEDTAKAIVLAGSDVDGDAITFMVVAAPMKGTLSGTAPNLTYTPNANANGADSFTFKVNDGTVDSPMATVSINITPVNDAPIANTQSVTMIEDTAKAITLTGSDVDGNTLTYTVVTLPTKGTLSGTAPNLTYTPNANVSGGDSFTFKVNDGNMDSSSATVAITITPANDAPVANAQTVVTPEDTAKAITLTGSDADGDTLTFAIVSQPANGTLSGTPPNLTYTPSADFNGSDSFTFRAHDGVTNSAVAMVSISVTPANDAPIASAQSVTAVEDTAKAIMLAGTDVDGDVLTFAIVTPPTKGTLSGTAPNLTYTPSANATGADSFTFRVNDGTVNSATATVAITITSANDAPVAIAQGVTTAEDTAKAITLAGSDADGDTLTFTVVAQPTKGTLSGAAPNLTYTPNANFNGSDSFTFKVNDGNVDSPVTTVAITVTPVNDAPVSLAQSVTTPEDTARTITLSATDVDGNTLVYSVVTPPASGTLSGSGANLTYTPAANFNGSDSFTFKVNDGTVDSAPALVSIAVTPVNDAPVANALAIATDRNVAKPVTLTGADVDGDPLTFAVVTSPTKGVLSGTAPNLTYTPNNNVTGSDSFTFRVNDGTLNSATATVSINIAAGPNTPPVADAQSATTPEDTARAIVLAGSDADGDALTFAVVSQPAKGTLSGTAPNLTYTPAANFNGSDSFTFRVNDGTTNSTPATVSLTVTPANDTPVANIQSVTTAEDTAKAITLAGSDVDGDPLTFTVVTPPAKGTLSGTVPNLTYTPNANANGADSFTFRVSDGVTNSAAATVAVTITPVNDAPVANAQSVATIEDTAKAITLTGSDVDGNTLTYAIVSQPAHGALSGTAPNVTYTPSANYNGADSFTFKVNDGTVDSAPATVAITVSAGNDAPVAVAQSVTTPEDTAKAITLTGTDADSDALTFTIMAQPTKGSLSGTAPDVIYTPGTNYTGADSFTFRVSDGTTNSAMATVSINVTPVNDLPVANAQNFTVAEDTAKAITLTGSDADGNALTFTVTTPPAHGTLSGTAPNLTFTPAANFNGADSFWFKVNDGAADSGLAVVSITVTPANDAPVAIAQAIATDRNVAKAVTLAGSDVDEDPLTFAVVTQPTKGVLTGTAPDLTYTPNNNVTGSDSFTFRVNDGTVNSATATVSINIAPGPNTAPVAIAQSVTTAEGTAKAITLAGSDADGDSLNFAVLTQPTHGTLSGTAPNVTYTPAANYNGADSFTFRVNDGTTNSVPATVSLTVTPVNGEPLATAQNVTTPEDTAKAITLAGADNDGDTLTFAVVTPPAHGTLSGTAPNLTYTPAANYNGTDSFWFKANDGTLDSALAVVSITVTPVNDAPSADGQSIATSEDTTKAFTLTGGDPDGNTVSFAIVTPPTHGTLSGTAPNLTYTPSLNFSGNDSFTFRANDGVTNSAPATVSVTIAPVNDAPTLDLVADLVLDENAGPQTVALTGISAGAPDETEPVTITASSSNPDLVPAISVNYLSPGTTGSLSFEPTPGVSGSALVTVVLNDGRNTNNFTTRTFTVTVNSATGPITMDPIPDLSLPPNAGLQNVSLSGISSSNVTSLSLTWARITRGPTPTIKIKAASSNTKLIPTPSVSYTSPNTSGSLSFAPVSGATGDVTITVTVDDGKNPSLVRSFGVSIGDVVTTNNLVNAAPTLDPIASLTLAQDAAQQTVGLTGITAGSGESQTLTVTVASSNLGLIPTPTVIYTSPNTTGSLRFTPVAGATGSATITVTVNDGQMQNGTITRQFTVTVQSGDLPPTIALTSPTTGASFGAPATVNLAANVNANNHTITKVQFYADATLLGEDTTAPYTADWNVENLGDYSLTARAYYDAGSTVDSAAAKISVSALPAPWQTADIGKVAAPGSASVTADSYTVAGAGNLSGTADSFRFVYQPLSRDGEIIARVTTAGSAGANARSGVMIRESLASNAQYAFLGQSPEGLYRWQFRSGSGANTSATTSAGGTSLTWVRLVRRNNLIIGYQSANGSSWSVVSMANIKMAQDVYVGFAVASGSADTLNTSVFTTATVVP